jgi:hypothetical protein
MFPLRSHILTANIVVRLRCDVCQRSGLYRLARLAAKYESEILLDDLLVRLSVDCGCRDEPGGNGFGVLFPDLPPRRHGLVLACRCGIDR